ncbi:MAG: protein kinase, partial [Holophagales bacterium]|nr:protein kinase [Holophagales bacterium]
MSGSRRQARWARLEALFHRAVELDPEARRAFLDEHLPGDSSADERFRVEPSADPEGLRDSELRRELEELLACDSRNTAWQGLDLGPAAASTPRIPGYEDLELVGHGGMGSVFRARRSDALFGGKVFAIKVLHAHRLDEHCRRRFHVERRLLASLDHPNIVRLYGGGVLEDGRPFLVMDHVEGEPLDLYCREHRLSVEDRLRLFRDLCGALQHAHQCLVVHRDLKP